MGAVLATVASVKFEAPSGGFTYVTRMGWGPEHSGKWAHGFTYRSVPSGRTIEEVHAEALAAAVADAKAKHGIGIVITNPNAALIAAQRAMAATYARNLRAAEAEAMEEDERG